MGEYLSPGVYMEEFESGSRPMDGVSTSIAGFAGFAERGPTEGPPQLVTSMGDFQRQFGGYLSEKEYGDYRYLAYAVEHFFTNGGSSCYVKRVALKTAQPANVNIPSVPMEENKNITINLTDKATNILNTINVEIKALSDSDKKIMEITMTDENTGSITNGIYQNITVGDIICLYAEKDNQGNGMRTERDGGEQPLYYYKKVETITPVGSGSATVSFTSEKGNKIGTQITAINRMFIADLYLAVHNERGGIIEDSIVSFNKRTAKYITREYQYVNINVPETSLDGYTDNPLCSPLEWLSGSKPVPGDTMSFLFESGIDIQAKEVGTWGNDISIKIEKNNKTKSDIVSYHTDGVYVGFQVKNCSAFQLGDWVLYPTDEQTPDLNNYTNMKFANITAIDSENNIIYLYVRDDNSLEKIKSSVYLANINVTVTYQETAETYEGVSLNYNSSNFLMNRLKESRLISVLVKTKSEDDQPVALDGYPYNLALSGSAGIKIKLTGGGNGTNFSSLLTGGNFVDRFRGDAKSKNGKTGLLAFEDNSVVSIMCLPGIVDRDIQMELLDHCEAMKSRFAILDLPQGLTEVTKVQDFREAVDSEYAAMYHPWIVAYDSLYKKSGHFPPSGAIAGVYARTDKDRGVFKAPANEIVMGATGLSISYSKGEQDNLNPIGVNLIRSFPGQGIRVWGARTISSNSLVRYVNVRRLLIYIEESIKANTNWVVFEPNNELLWIRVKRTIEVFLDTVWRSGALFGSKPDEAYYVNIGYSTMSQSDIDNGKLICEIGVAPVKPAEFVILRLTQMTGGA